MKSIQSRLVLSTILAIIPVLLLTALYINHRLSQWISVEFDQNLQAKANLLATLTKNFPEGIELDFAGEFMPEFERVGGEYFQLWLSNGTILERSDSLQTNDLPHSERWEIGAEFGDLLLPDGRAGRAIELVFMPQVPEPFNGISIDAENSELVRLVVAVEHETQLALFRQLRQIGSLIVIASVAAIILLMRAGIKRSLLPLAQTGQQIQKIDIEHLDSKLELDNPTQELDTIISQFNKLMERLQKSFDREKRFSADVAHELRTPISAILTTAEVYRERLSRDDESYKALDSIVEVAEEMKILVNKLMELTKSDSVVRSSSKEVVNIYTMVSRVLQEYTSEDIGALSSNVDLTVVGSPDFKIERVEFGYILKNLLDNAIKYRAPNTKIFVRFENANELDTWRLSVSNTAADLSQSDLPFMCERLWRKSDSRTDSSSAGIGLAIVKAYCDRLALNLELDLSATSLFQVTLRSSES